jgi:diguanylate cyclase (GGDEF)-like protein/PAS domain S-box-containing protein
VLPIQQYYHYEIVLLSIAIAILGSYTSLELANRFSSHDKRRFTWLISSSFIMGICIWAMHFTGMLALHSFHYFNIKLTILSFGASFLGSFISFLPFYYYHTLKSKWQIAFSGTVLGLGIAAMHYLGMGSMKTTYIIHYNFILVSLSVILAICLSILSMFLWNRLRMLDKQSFWNKSWCSVFQGMAISGMHYVSMQATSLYSDRHFHTEMDLNHHSLVSVIVVLTTFIFCAGILLSYKDKTEALRRAVVKEIKYQSLFKHNQDGILLMNKLGIFIDANSAVESITGFSFEELLGNRFHSFIRPEDIPFVSKMFHDSLAGFQREYHLRIFHKNRMEVLLRIKNVPLVIQDKIDGVYVIIKDMTIQQNLEKTLNENTLQYEAELKLRDENYRLIAENSSDLIRIVDISGSNSYASPSHLHVLGYTPDEIIGKRFDTIIHPDDKEGVNRIYQNHFNRADTILTEYRYQHKNGTWVWLEAQATQIYDDNGKLSHFVVVSRNISERKHYEEKLKQLAFYDVLTGIPNRRLFNDRLSQSIRKAKRNRTQLALFYLDCDRFKWVNDSLGHETGDLLLKGFVERVESCLRETDTIARLGGDEFAIIIDGFDTTHQVARIANQIIQTTREPWNINGHEFIATASIGIAIYPDDGGDINTLLAHADRALYESKENGRNQYQFFTKEISTKIEKNMLLEDGLKMAIAQGHLHLVYQPQMNIQTGKMVGVEALLRYTHPVLGLISPVEFIPICEKLAIMDELTEWVIASVFKQQKEWEENGYSPIHIAINISPTTLENNSFIEMTKTLLDEFQTNPETIEFELTEDAFIHNMQGINTILKNLKEMGLRISLDDFGAGYSSLKYLKDLPIDKVKIDRTFVKDIPFNEKEKAIIECIVSLTNRLNGEVLCEGVETEEQLIFLQNQGCQLAQGYYFSQPLTNVELEDQWLKPIGTKQRRII